MLKPHLKYLWYVLRHKWYVFIECCKLGIPWRGLVHDFSKFSPVEWGPYVEAFYGDYGYKFNGGYAYEFKKNEIAMSAFDAAWLHHQHCNPHHWQWWILRGDQDAQKVLPMPDKYMKEMLADWRGAGKAQGKPDNKGWYEANKDKMKLHPDTRKWIEVMLNA